MSEKSPSPCKPLPLPPRQQPLTSLASAPSNPAEQVPLSRMTIEELMHVLPTLNAAIIAHDWIPCMRKRHRELRIWLQNNKLDINATEELNTLTCVSLEQDSAIASGAKLCQELTDIIDQSDEVAQKYHDLFAAARKLQERDDKKKDEQIYEATVQKSEALIELARVTGHHEEVCAQYEREITAYKDKVGAAMVTFKAFLKEHIGAIMQNVPRPEIRTLFDAFVDGESRDNYSEWQVPAQVHKDLEAASQKFRAERDGLSQVCLEQSKVIKQQSTDLDRYVEKLQKMTTDIKNKGNENAKLTAEIARLRSQKQKKGKGNARPATEPAITDHPPVLADNFDEELWSRDAEITNLRRKLDKSCTREKELQTQIRQLLQTYQAEQDASEKPPSRLKRLLGGQQKSSPSIPSMNSMSNLGASILTPFSKDKSAATTSLSPQNISRPLPFVSADDIKLPPPHQQPHQSALRDPSPAAGRQQPRLVSMPSHDEIDVAVSGRFQQLPNRTRSTDPLNQTSASSLSEFSSYDEVPEHNARVRTHATTDNSSVGSGGSVSPNHRGQYLVGRPMVNDRHHRVLSGITEVTEPSGSSIKRGSGNTGSPDSLDRKMYLENINAERVLRRKI